MSRIAIIGASELQNPLILKAKEMGLETHAFAWEANDIGEKTADRFYPISITEKEKIKEKCKELGVCAVVSVASDLAVKTVNYVARNLGLTANSFESDVITTNKFYMRDALRAAGIVTPAYALATEGDIPQCVYSFKFPLIVKPTDRSGSRGVYKIESENELKSAVVSAAKQSFERKTIVEEFISGDEYSCECISFNGKHSLLAVTKKFTTGAPHFIETGHMEPSGLVDDQIEKIKETVFCALDALKIEYGASHSEFRIGDDGVVRIIEIGSRMGGDCIGTDLVPLSTGHDFVKMVIDVACGKAPTISASVMSKTAEIRFILRKEDYSKYERIKREQPNSIIRTSERIIMPEAEVTDSSNRYGFYIVAKE